MDAQARKAHFIGICGVGMSAVAKLLHDEGWTITGSDAGIYPPISDVLRALGFACRSPHDPANIPADVDLIVIGKHAKLTPEHNPEVRAAFERRDRNGTPVQSFPEVLHRLTQGTRNIVVAGSYGKSSTTALLAWMLLASGKDPSYFIGAVPTGFAHSSQLGRGEFFVLEGDEYPAANWDRTSKFLFYSPQTVLLTSCEYDHFNEFPDEQAYRAPYRQLVRQLPADGLLVACLDGVGVRDVAADATCRVVTYATDPEAGADYTVGAIRTDGPRTRFTVRNAGAEVVEIETDLLGRHSIQNILGATAALREMGALTPEEIAQAVSSFRGLRRRLELRTTHSSVRVYEDLSSSRPKGMAALAALRERFPQARLTAAFHPHTFSFRSAQARGWYPGMFADADEVLVLSPPTLGRPAAGELSQSEITACIAAGNSCPVRAVSGREEILDALMPTLRPGDVVLLMSSGGIEDIASALVAAVEETSPPKE